MELITFYPSRFVLNIKLLGDRAQFLGNIKKILHMSEPEFIIEAKLNNVII